MLTKTSYSFLRDVHELAPGLRVEAGPLGEIAKLEVPGAVGRVDDQADDRIGVGLGDLLDVDATFGATDHDRRLAGPVDGDRQVVLGGDVDGLFDEQPADQEPFERLAEHPGGERLRLAPACWPA